MRMVAIFLILIGCVCPQSAQAVQLRRSMKQLPAAVRYNALNDLIRDSRITPQTARRKYFKLLPLVEKQFAAQRCLADLQAGWVFPVEGYDLSSVGGHDGNGWRYAGGNYFDTKKSRGHPAHDIFIRDRNRQALDDLTGKPVHVLSMSSGIVIAVTNQWHKGSPWRGGNYVWVYDTVSRGIFYYAHLSRAIVRPGQCVRAGTVLGDVGRSGVNAAAYRSETHLHFAYLKLEGSYPRPRDPYPELQRTAAKAKEARANAH